MPGPVIDIDGPGERAMRSRIHSPRCLTTSIGVSAPTCC